jgi:hypothetical protein
MRRSASVGISKAHRREFGARMSGSFDSRSPRSLTSPSNCAATRSTWRRSSVEQGGRWRAPVEQGDRSSAAGRPAGDVPAVVDHLDAMLDRAQRAIGVADHAARRPGRAARPAQRASASSVAGARSDGSRPPWISCWTWVKNSPRECRRGRA